MSKSDENVEIPVIVISPATFKFSPIPTPPETINAPFVGSVELVVLLKYAIPLTVVLDESITLVIINFSVGRSQTKIIPSTVLSVDSTSDKLINLVVCAVALDKT